MNVGKIALILGGLVIIGLIIFAVISGLLPAVFEYAGCAFKSFLSPSGGGTLNDCATQFGNKFGGFFTP